MEVHLIGLQSLCVIVVLLTVWWLSQRIKRWLDRQSASELPFLQKWTLPVAHALPTLIGGLVLLELVPVFNILIADQPWLLIRAACVALLSLACVRFFLYTANQLYGVDSWLVRAEGVTTSLVLVSTLLGFSDLGKAAIDFLNQVPLSVTNREFSLWFLFRSIAIVLLSLVALVIIGRMLERRLLAGARMDSSQRTLLGRVYYAILSVLGLFLGLSMAGVDATSFTIFSGALGVGLGLGLQKIAANYVSGFILLLDRSIRLGNVVLLDNNQELGIVTRMHSRFTVLRTLMGTELIYPNDVLFNSVVINYSYSDRRVRLTTAIAVDYSADINLVEKIICEAALTHPRILATPPPEAYVTEFTERGFRMECWFWISDPENGMVNVRSEVNRRIWDSFRAHKIIVPYPHRVLINHESNGEKTSALKVDD